MSTEIKRLILAKSLYLHGCIHASKKDQINKMLAIHHFDFAVEMVLKCLATKHNIVSSPKQEYKVKDLWNAIINKGINLPLRDQIFNLHYARNLVQHAGIVPSSENIIMFKGYVEDFLSKIVKEEFSIPFERLSLAELIVSPELKEITHKAEECLEKGQYEECIKFCDAALIKATFEVADIFGKAGMLTGYFGAADELKNVISKDYAEKYKEKEFYTPVKDLSRAALQLGQASTGMQFLNEYRSKFLEFREIINNLEIIPKKQLKDKAQFSLDFIIGLIVKWQEEGMISL